MSFSNWTELCLQTYKNNRTREKVTYFLRKRQTLLLNNSRILRIENAKLSGYYFYINTSIWRDFQICISVRLTNVCNYADDTTFHACDSDICRLIKRLEHDSLLTVVEWFKSNYMKLNKDKCHFIKLYTGKISQNP